MSCLFCRIVTLEIPADIVAESELSVAFNDISPQAPTHVLIVPKTHYDNAAELAEASTEAIADLFQLAGEIADAR
jgi:histidine triad (HIT) family protein